MNPAFWIERWSEGKIGFHEGKPNGFLTTFADRLDGARRVLVPLCGKSEDLAYLAGRGHEVVGVELAEDAVRQFFVEHGIEPAVETRDGSRRYVAGSVEIFAGDLFAISRALVGEIDAIYDRAALVALPLDMRDRYSEHLRRIAGGANRELLVTVEYPETSMSGPPFSVLEDEVRARFADATVELLETRQDPRARADGAMIERCYDIRW